MEDSLLRKAKAAAAEDGISLTVFIEGALRRQLDLREQAQNTERTALPSHYGKGGLLPGVDLDDSASLLDIMEAP